MKYYYIVSLVNKNFQTKINTNFVKTPLLDLGKFSNSLKENNNFDEVIILNFIEVNEEFIKLNSTDLIDK